MSLHPSSMLVVDSFAAIGTQIKLQLPGKATAANPCDSIEGPSVILKDGRYMRLDNYEDAEKFINQIDQIVDLGEILIPVGEFIENNHNLEPSGWCSEWWNAIIESHEIPKYEGNYDFDSLLEYSRSNGIPLHPKYTYFWADISVDEVSDLRNQLIRDSADVVNNNFKLIYKEIFLKLGLFYQIKDQRLILNDGFKPLVTQLGLIVKNSKLVLESDANETDNVIELISSLSKVEIKNRAPTRVGASMGRPEKANERRMKPPPHVLFPLGNSGGNQRLVNSALTSNAPNRGFSQGRAGRIEMEVQLRYCKKCNNETISINCCNSQTMVKESPKRRLVDISELVTKAMNNVKTGILPKVKGTDTLNQKTKFLNV